MKANVSALERAFQLAESGRYSSTEDIRRRLAAEGYDSRVLAGPALRKQIRTKLAAGRGPMPKGPKGQKRPADVIGNAVKVMRIATGEETEDVVDDGKDPAAKSLGSKGGKARREALSPKRRKEIAKAAAAKRWAKT